MKLLPSLRQKKRYIVFELSQPVQAKEAVMSALQSFLGTLGMSKASPLFVKEKNQRFIIKVNHKYVDEAIAAIILIKKINKRLVSVKSIITSGTIKKAQSYL